MGWKEVQEGNGSGEKQIVKRGWRRINGGSPRMAGEENSLSKGWEGDTQAMPEE